jgi:nucleotide-binding universal stress UspA family protein
MMQQHGSGSAAMPVRKILVPLDGSERDRSALTAAFSVGRAFEAHVEGMHVQVKPVDTLPFVGEGMSASLVQELIELTERENAVRAANAHEMFDVVREAAQVPIAAGPGTAAAGPSAAWVERRGAEEETLVDAGRLADLIVIARPEGGIGIGSATTFGAVLFETGRPVLVAGSRALPLHVDRIIVAWDGSVQAARALGAALPFLAHAEEVTVLTAREPESDEQDPADVGSYLAWHGIAADCRSITQYRNVGEALLTAAVGADLLVMGGYSHSRLREVILGGVTRYMLEKAALPLLLAH